MKLFYNVLAVVFLTLIFYIVYAVIKVNSDVKKQEKEKKDSELN